MMLETTTVFSAKRLGVITCSSEQTLLIAAKQMVAEDISALVVIDEDGTLAGIISRIDILRARMEKEAWQDQLVKDFMATQVVTVAPWNTLLETARIMIDQRIHRVVVARGKRGEQIPVSVVSAADIVYHMVKDENNV